MQRPDTMFDLTSSKLLILAVVALIVVGPKDLPALLRTVGRYMGMIRRQANEFRAQFEEAMRETELADLKKEVEDLGKETQESLNEASRTVESQVGDVSRELNETLAEVEKPLEQKAGLEELPHEPTAATPASEPAVEPPPAAMPRQTASDITTAERPREEPAVADAGASHGRTGA